MSLKNFRVAFIYILRSNTGHSCSFLSFYIPFLECKHPEATEVQHHLAFIREKTNTLDWEKNNR